MPAPPFCGRCSAPPDGWWCWWCGAPLCARCGDENGHCGHSEAEEVNRRTAAATPEERRAIAAELARRRRGRN